MKDFIGREIQPGDMIADISNPAKILGIGYVNDGFTKHFVRVKMIYIFNQNQTATSILTRIKYNLCIVLDDESLVNYIDKLLDKNHELTVDTIGVNRITNENLHNKLLQMIEESKEIKEG